MARHGRLHAHLYLADGTWLQGEMLSRGLARVYTFDDSRSLVPEMLARERAARAAAAAGVAANNRAVLDAVLERIAPWPDRLYAHARSA